MSDYPQLIDELLATVALIEVSPDVFEGKSHDYVGSRIFGGQVLAQAILVVDSRVIQLLLERRLHPTQQVQLR